MMWVYDHAEANVPERVEVKQFVEGARNRFTLDLYFAGKELTFFANTRRELASMVTAIADAFERGTGDFLVPRECAGCGKYLGVGISASRGVTHGTCPDCMAKQMKAAGLSEDRGGPDGPVADSADGYRVSAAEAEAEGK